MLRLTKAAAKKNKIRSTSWRLIRNSPQRQRHNAKFVCHRDWVNECRTYDNSQLAQAQASGGKNCFVWHYCIRRKLKGHSLNSRLFFRSGTQFRCLWNRRRFRLCGALSFVLFCPESSCDNAVEIDRGVADARCRSCLKAAARKRSSLRVGCVHLPRCRQRY